MCLSKLTNWKIFSTEFHFSLLVRRDLTYVQPMIRSFYPSTTKFEITKPPSVFKPDIFEHNGGWKLPWVPSIYRSHLFRGNAWGGSVSEMSVEDSVPKLNHSVTEIDERVLRLGWFLLRFFLRLLEQFLREIMIQPYFTFIIYRV